MRRHPVAWLEPKDRDDDDEPKPKKTQQDENGHTETVHGMPKTLSVANFDIAFLPNNELPRSGTVK